MIHCCSTIEECHRSVNTAFEKTLDLVLDLTEDFKEYEKIPIQVGECFECGDRVVGTISGDDVEVCPGCGEPIRMDCTVDMIIQGSVVMYQWTDDLKVMQ